MKQILQPQASTTKRFRRGLLGVVDAEGSRLTPDKISAKERPISRMPARSFTAPSAAAIK